MLATIIISAIITILFVTIVVNEVKKRKNGTGGCSCGGNCGSCGINCHSQSHK